MTTTNSGPGIPRSNTFAGYLSRKNCYPIRVDPDKKWHDPVNIPSKYWDKLSSLDKTVLHLFADSENLTVALKREHQKTFRNACSRLQQWFIRSDPERYAEEKKRTTEYNQAVKRGEIEPIRGKYTRSSIGNRAMPISMKEFHYFSGSSDVCVDGPNGASELAKEKSVLDYSLMVEPKFSDSVVCLLNRELEVCFSGTSVAIPEFILETPFSTVLSDPFEQKPEAPVAVWENIVLPSIFQETRDPSGAAGLPPMIS